MTKRFLYLALPSLVCVAAAFAIAIHMKNSSQKPAASYIGRQQVEVQDGVMTPEVLLALGRMSDPQLSPDGSRILYGVSYTSVADNRSCRNLFVCNADGSDPVQLTTSPKSISNARWSNDGRSVYYLMGGQLYKCRFNGSALGGRKQISKVPAGIGEFKLSPDGKSIMYISTVPGPVKGPADVDPALDKAQAYIADDLMYRHWDHWVTETPRTYIASLDKLPLTGEDAVDILGAEPFELPTEPFGGLEQLAWHPDGRLIAYSCRKKTGIEYAFSTDTDIYIYDTVTGTTAQLTHGGGYDTDPVWSPDGSHLAWISMERDGYEADRQRLMVCNKDLSDIRELTSDFIFDAASPVWTPDSKGLVFPSTVNAVGSLCHVTLEGDGVRRLTPAEWLYSLDAPFGLEVDEDGSFRMLAGFTSMMQPTELASIVVAPDGNAAIKQITHENEAILSQLGQIRQEQICLDTPQGEKLYCWVLYPAGFDPSKKYAAVEMFNGGPQTSLDQHWSYRWNFFMMAQQGYVVLLPNRHGDSGFGQPWKEQISGDYQGLNMQDYMQTARWAKAQQWCSGVAGVGASYGGFSVYNMMGIHGDLFDCFIAHAGIFDEKAMWYTTEESWFANWDGGGLREYSYTPGQQGPAGDGVTFGGMQQAGAPYADVAKSQYHYAHDPSSRVTAWHTPILCIHGMMDFRIPYEQGMAAFNAARMMGVPARLVIFPEENHWIIQPQNALLWHKEFFAWLDKWM